jgi:membrane associated rhomboid family serine protease
MLVPYATERRLHRVPSVTYTLVGLNCLVFGVMWAMGKDAMWSAFREFGVVPGKVQWYTVVTSLFIHANLLHLAGNMLFLWVFGRHVEDALGRKLFAVVYFSSGVAAIVLHTAMAYLFARAALDVPAVGASGAISGVLGVFAVRFYKTRIKVLTFVPVRMLTFSVASVIGLGIWLASQVMGGLITLGASGGVAN